MESNLKQIWQPIQDGSESIETWWPRHEQYIESITRVDTDEEVMILSAAYYRFGMFKHNEGYSKQALPYIEKALEVIETHKGKLYENQYKDSLEAIMESKCGILYKLERYWDAYRIMNQLHSMKPQKDDYIIGRKNLFSANISKWANPLYIVFACIWGAMLLEQYVFKTHYIPSVIWTITWACWIVLLIIQFVIPFVWMKIRK